MKSHFWYEKVKILSLCMQNSYERLYITLQNILRDFKNVINAKNLIFLLCEKQN